MKRIQQFNLFEDFDKTIHTRVIWRKAAGFNQILKKLQLIFFAETLSRRDFPNFRADTS